MKTTFLALLSLGILVTGCNEKVSPDLDKGAATSDTTIAPDVYTFEVVNDSPVILNYKLHRTGAARGSTECKVSRAGSPLTNTQYTGESVIAHDSKNYDVTCFFEAEELSLYFSGIDFTVKSSQNTCDYIGYSPYSYFNYQPGDSSTTLTRVNCTTSALGIPNPSAATVGLALVPSDSGGKIGCNQVLDAAVTIPLASSSPANDNDFCKYDYSASDGPNCDKGSITINEVNCAINAATSATNCTSGTKTSVSCGGQVVNCVDGPIKKVTLLSKFTSGTEATEAKLNTPLEIKYSLPGGIDDQRLGNYHIANYRRDLANPHVNFIDRTIGNFGTYKASFTPYLRAFDPLVMESYGRNQPYGGTGLMIPVPTTTAAELGGPIKTKPLAADPIMGMPGSKVSPFYTFYCFDRAFDIKARIRMVVRDWDRVFSSDTTELEKLTDIVLSEPRQDNNGEEVSSDPGDYNGFNDIIDWDDKILMQRTPGAVSTGTVWEPMNGFYSPLNFPSDS